ncbi:MAG: ABC transporter substrate-binding protein [Pyrinomonadaceae bacterium]|nr:ABC transporter substrate-binding protein [Pyrinomonadaceae bacterium]MBP6211728.1 ABC transporter substrate-binding protein [Pyrinomonadaceae bacterium]
MKKGKSERVLIVVVLALLGFAGCRGRADVSQRPSVVPMRVVTDDLGRRVTIPVRVERVVSTAPSVTENIFAVGAGDRLVGVTTFCNYPEQAKTIAKIGDTMNPNMESIVALKPDIVFVSTASQIETFTKTLEQNGIAVYVSNPATLTEVLSGLESLSDVFGTQEKVGKLLPDLKRRVNVVSLKVQDDKKPVVFVQISREPLFTIGADSFLTHLIFKAGGDSVTAGVPTAFPKINPEAAMAYSPEVIILSDSDDNKEPNEVFKNSPAVKNGRVYRINADLISRPGPRLVDALEQIARDLHPEKFK